MKMTLLLSLEQYSIHIQPNNSLNYLYSAKYLDPLFGTAFVSILLFLTHFIHSLYLLLYIYTLTCCVAIFDL